jgi:hypothetical protein
MRTLRMTTVLAAIAIVWVAGRAQTAHVRLRLRCIVPVHAFTSVHTTRPARAPAVCTEAAVCPDKQLANGQTVAATGCTHNSLQPQPGDRTKRIGCFCGGVDGDTFSQYACDTMQPWTHWVIELFAADNATDLADGSLFNASIYERAGTPPNVRPTSAHSCVSYRGLWHRILGVVRAELLVLSQCLLGCGRHIPACQQPAQH